MRVSINKAAKARGDAVDCFSRDVPQLINWDVPTNIVIENCHLHKDTNWNFVITLQCALGSREAFVINGPGGTLTIECSWGFQDIIVTATDVPPQTRHTNNRTDFKTPINQAFEDLYEGQLHFLDANGLK
jgi:hypothetical protein